MWANVENSHYNSTKKNLFKLYKNFTSWLFTPFFGLFVKWLGWSTYNSYIFLREKNRYDEPFLMMMIQENDLW